MNNKIKEILEIQEDSDYKKLSIEDILLLKGYITKLQQCHCNRTDCSGRIKDSKKYDSVYQEKELYKSRINKAIEDIDKLINGGYEEINGDSVKYYHTPRECCIERLEVVKKDLLGSDKE